MQSLLSPSTSRVIASPAQLIAFFLNHYFIRPIVLHIFFSGLMSTSKRFFLGFTPDRPPGRRRLSTPWLVWFYQGLGVDATRFERRLSDPEWGKKEGKIPPHSLRLIYLFASMLCVDNYCPLCLFCVLPLHLCTWWCSADAGVQTAAIVMQFASGHIFKGH